MQPDLPYPDRSTRSFSETMFGRIGLVRRINIAMLPIFALIPIVLVDWIRSTTTLITPIPSALWTDCLIGGCALGLILASLMAALAWVQKGFKGHSIGVTFATFLFVALIFTPIYALASIRVAWRAAEIEAFAGSKAPMTPARYREQSYDHTDRGEWRYYVRIDPFHTGYATGVPMPGVDYRRLMSAERQDLAYGFCAKVMEQRSNGAVRIHTGQVADDAPSQLVWCPDHVFGD
jgi:hypothetical protein